MKHLSLCSGIGGLDLAAEWAGFETAAQCEIDEYASKVLAKNFPGVPNLHDIRTVTNERLAEFGIDAAEITVISAGFPCQPYSLAGKGRGDYDERDLWGEVARVVGEVCPRWFVGENTPGLFARNNQRYFKRILRDLSSMGYSVGWGIWGACDVGAPHKRERIFIIGNLSDAACERCYSSKIQRSVFAKGRDAEDARRIQEGRMQPKRVCCDFPRERLCTGGEWEVEPDVGRVADGVSCQVDRLRCLGNAVVPQQAYPIFQGIADIENQIRRSKNEKNV